MPSLHQIMNAINQLAPWDLAEDWDRVGLQVGDKNKPVQKLMVALDLNRQILEEGIALQVDCFLVHHPLIFKPLTQINFTQPTGALLVSLIQHNQSLIAAHTNVDKAESGLNQVMAQKFGLTDLETLHPVAGQLCKVVVFTPVEHVPNVRTQMALAGAGVIGEYTECSFACEGRGSFKPGELTNPYLGEPGQLEEVSEIRLEMVVEQRKLSEVIRVVHQSHPYEEPAIDIYPLLNSHSHGLGRIGYLPKPVSLQELCLDVKTKFQVANLRYWGDQSQVIRRVAVCSGSGASLLSAAIAKGADAFITADLKYHDYLIAKDHGLAVIDAGHGRTEAEFSLLMLNYLKHFFHNESSFEVITSNTIITEPYLTFE